jgi:hypothetical protein
MTFRCRRAELPAKIIGAEHRHFNGVRVMGMTKNRRE